MIQVRNCKRSDRAFLVELVPQDSDPIPAFLGIGRDDIARGTKKVFGFPAWWVLAITRWLRAPLARLLVAEYDGTPVGFVSVSFQRGHGLIGSLITDPFHRRKGIATALMEAAEAATRARGDRVAVLEVNKGNEGARSLYSRRGYRVIFVNHWFEGSLPAMPTSFGGSPTSARNATKGDLRDVRFLRLRSLPPSVVGLLPPSKEDPGSIDRLARSKGGEHRAWCIGPRGAPSGLVRAYTTAQGAFSFLSCPYLGASTNEVQQNELVETALDWLRTKKATRTVSVLPSYSGPAMTTFRRVGLVERHQSEIMFRELD